MSAVHHSSFCVPNTYNKVVIGTSAALSVTIFVIAVIGLTASPQGPFNVIVHFGITINGLLFGGSIFVLILDCVAIKTLYTKNEKKDINQNQNKTIELKYTPPLSVPFVDIPNELLLAIFSHLDLPDLYSCTNVTHRWRGIASDATLWGDPLPIIDKTEWAKYADLSNYGIVVDDIPDLSNQTLLYLKMRIALLKIEENRGAFIILIPQGLTCDNLIKIVSSPKEGHSSQIQYADREFMAQRAHIPVKQGYWLLITESILENTRGLSFNEHKKQLKALHMEMPSTLEVSTLIFFNYMRTGKSLYNAGLSDLLTHELMDSKLKEDMKLVSKLSSSVERSTSTSCEEMNTVGNFNRLFGLTIYSYHDPAEKQLDSDGTGAVIRIGPHKPVYEPLLPKWVIMQKSEEPSFFAFLFS